MRRARLESECADPETAAAVAGALAPDNTDDIETRVEGSTVVTTVDRPTTTGMRSTLDDYVVNLDVAVQLTTTEHEDTNT